MRADRVNGLARRLLGPFGIEPITPLAFAAFRAAFGLGLLYVQVVYQPFRPKPFDVRNPHGPLASAEWINALAMNHTALSILQVVACTAAGLFIAGILARLAYVVVVSMMFLNVQMILTRTGGHDWGLPIMTLIVMTIVPWNDAPSLWRLRRSWAAYAAPPLASRVYGFAVWIPGLMVGLAFAAAAYAKIGGTGLQWITNGTVRYHFVEDGRNAPITLGLWIATHERLSVALSFAAVFVEAVFILAAFARDWRTRLAFGLMGASLMAGFALLQGVTWWPWWLLFLSFLPWTLFAASPGPATHQPGAGEMAPRKPRDLTWVHAALVVTLVGVQVWASWTAVEKEPFISNFPMYAYTWSSPDDFNRHQVRTRFEAAGVDITEAIEFTNGERVLRQMATMSDAPGQKEPDPQALERFTASYTHTYGALPSSIDIVVVQRPFDWQRGTYLPPTREYVGTAHLSR